MFRRRPLRPPPWRRPPGAVPPAVREAECLFQQGRYLEAARRFEALANEAGRRHLWQPAGNLHLRAGQAFLEADKVEPAIEQARRALGALLRAGRPGRARHRFQQILQALESRGYRAQAEALRQEVADRLGGVATAGISGPRFQLPTNCSSCGAPLKEGEFRRVRADAVECSYCGALVQVKPLEI